MPDLEGNPGYSHGRIQAKQGVPLSSLCPAIKVRSLNCLRLDTLGMGMASLGRRLTPILIAKLVAEALETTRIHRLAGLTGTCTALVTMRPFRAPHHTISDVCLIGGGQVPRPGEVLLARHGHFFLDERWELTGMRLRSCNHPQSYTPAADPLRPGPGVHPP
jgi:hypothetical protein